MQRLSPVLFVALVSGCSAASDSEVSTSVLGRAVGSPAESLTRTAAEPASEARLPDGAEGSGSTTTTPTVSSSVVEEGDDPVAPTVDVADAPVAPTASVDSAEPLPLPAVVGPDTAAETPSETPSMPDPAAGGADDVPPGADLAEPEMTTTITPPATDDDAPPGAEALPAAVPPSVPALPDVDDAPPGAFDVLDEAQDDSPPDEPDAPPGALDLP